MMPQAQLRKEQRNILMRPAICGTLSVAASGLLSAFRAARLAG
jgi:hypothetical protein